MIELETCVVSPHRPSKFKSSSWIFLPPTNNWIILWASNRCILVTCTSLIRSASDVQFKSPSYNNEYLPGAPKNWCFWTVMLEKTLDSPFGLQGGQTSQSWRKSVLNMHWRDWCWSWNSNWSLQLVTWCEEPTHWKRPWCWEKLRAGGEGDDRGWDGWMASLIQWTWVWASSRRRWRTGKHGMLQSMGSQRVRHDLASEQQQ